MINSTVSKVSSKLTQKRWLLLNTNSTASPFYLLILEVRQLKLLTNYDWLANSTHSQHLLTASQSPVHQAKWFYARKKLLARDWSLVNGELNQVYFLLAAKELTTSSVGFCMQVCLCCKVCDCCTCQFSYYRVCCKKCCVANLWQDREGLGNSEGIRGASSVAKRFMAWLVHSKMKV